MLRDVGMSNGREDGRGGNGDTLNIFELGKRNQLNGTSKRNARYGNDSLAKAV